MRALLIYPEMRSSYWSLENLCRISGWKSLGPPLGLMTVAALLPPDWQLRLVDENVRSVTEADWQWAEVVLLSGMLVQRPALLRNIRQAKARGKTVIVGGADPSSSPEVMLAAGADFLLRGEAEDLLPALLEGLTARKTGSVYHASRKPSLTASPVPRFDLLDFRDYGAMNVQTSRGCPHDCEFCDVVSLFGRKPRYKSPAQVLNELTALYRLGWRGDVFFCDDNYIGNPSHARKILAALIPWLKEHGEPFSFWTQASLDLGHDLEMIDLLTEANFSHVFIGIESLDEGALKVAGKRQNLKHPAVEAVNTITANGLTVIGSFILGCDGEQNGAGERIQAFVEATQMPQLMLNLMVPLPNTRLWERLIREKRLLIRNIDEDWQNVEMMGGRLVFRPTRPEVEILAEYYRLWLDLQHPAKYLERAYRYYLFMRPTRAALAKSKGQPAVAEPAQKTAAPSFSLRHSLHQLLPFLRLSWRLGVMSPQRGLYWGQLVGLWRRNPTRLVRYLKDLAFGLDMFALRETVLKRGQAMAEGSPLTP